MSTNILDPSALISRLPNLLSASKTLKSQQDGIVALLHSAMSALSFRLTGVDDESSVGAFSDNVLPDEWNKNGPNHYTLNYKHDQSSLEFVIKVSKLGTRTVVNAIALESEKAASLDISTNDFTSPSFFPHNTSAAEAAPLVHGFIASNRVADFITQFKFKIVQKLVPGLRKEGYTEVAEEPSAGASTGQPRPQQPEPARPEPDRPESGPPLRAPYSHIPPQNPLEIGRRDRDPFPNMPTNPFAPPPLFPNAGGDGMFVGPGHPIFGGRGPGGGGNSPFGGQPAGPWGGDGFLPPLGAPPGARFDPVGPFPGRGPFGGGLPGRGNMRGPDNDEFMPPGPHDSMYM